jgi:hypothetical protein
MHYIDVHRARPSSYSTIDSKRCAELPPDRGVAACYLVANLFTVLTHDAKHTFELPAPVQ